MHRQLLQQRAACSWLCDIAPSFACRVDARLLSCGRSATSLACPCAPPPPTPCAASDLTACVILSLLPLP